jgi:hypothetical protein
MNKYLKTYIRNRNIGIGKDLNINDYEMDYINDIDIKSEEGFEKLNNIIKYKESPYKYFNKINKNTKINFIDHFNFGDISLKNVQNINEYVAICLELENLTRYVVIDNVYSFIHEAFMYTKNVEHLVKILGDKLFIDYIEENEDYIEDILNDIRISNNYRYDNFVNLLKKYRPDLNIE